MTQKNVPIPYIVTFGSKQEEMADNGIMSRFQIALPQCAQINITPA